MQATILDSGTVAPCYEGRRINLPIGRRNDILGLIDRFRDFQVSDTEVYGELKKMGFSHQLALDYMDLVTSTRIA